VDRLRIQRPEGVLELFPVWAKIGTDDWERLLKDVDELDIVMNFCDTLLDGFGLTFRTVFDRGGRICLWLPDPSNPETLDRLVRLYGVEREEIAGRIVKSASRLDWLREDSEVEEASVEIRVMKEMLTSPLMRLNRTRVLLSHYDQFYAGHPKAMALLIDLTESQKLQKYWDDQFKEFTSMTTAGVDLLRERAGRTFPVE
jgi:hypothetical protein